MYSLAHAWQADASAPLDEASDEVEADDEDSLFDPDLYEVEYWLLQERDD
jgi:hypothetical protein